MTDKDDSLDNKNIEESKLDDISKNIDTEKEAEEKTIEEKYNETFDALLRAKAEVENIKKRSEKEINNAYKFSTEGIFLDLIPIYESLDIAISQGEEKTTADKLMEGNKLLKNMFDSLLEKNSLEVINPINQKFDPNLHQAIKTIQDDKKENNFVDEVLQKGYKLVDRVIKPALVVVIKN